MSDDDLVRPASTQYSDMVGTVACEPNIDGLELYNLFGLDSTETTIMGIEIYNETGFVQASVYVVEASTEHLADVGGFASLASSNHGQLPVTKYTLDSDATDVGGFINDNFKRFSIVATGRHFDWPMVITALRERSADGTSWIERGV